MTDLPEPVSAEMVSRLTELRDRHPGHAERYPDQVRPGGPRLVRYTARAGATAMIEADARTAVTGPLREQAATFLAYPVRAAAANLTKHLLAPGVLGRDTRWEEVMAALTRFDQTIDEWRAGIALSAEVTRSRVSVDTIAGVFVGYRMERLPDGDEWDARDAWIDQPDGTTSITFPAMGPPTADDHEITLVGRWVARWDGREPILIPITGRSIVPGREPDPAPSFGDGWTWGVWFIGDLP